MPIGKAEKTELNQFQSIDNSIKYIQVYNHPCSFSSLEYSLHLAETIVAEDTIVIRIEE